MKRPSERVTPPTKHRRPTLGSLLRAVGEAPPVDVRIRLALQPGARLERFTVEHVLGEGGMGVVVAAHDAAVPVVKPLRRCFFIG